MSRLYSIVDRPILRRTDIHPSRQTAPQDCTGVCEVVFLLRPISSIDHQTTFASSKDIRPRRNSREGVRRAKEFAKASGWNRYWVIGTSVDKWNMFRTSWGAPKKRFASINPVAVVTENWFESIWAYVNRLNRCWNNKPQWRCRLGISVTATTNLVQSELKIH